MANLLFYYLGDDEAYSRALMGEFKALVRLPIDVKMKSPSDGKNIQSLFIQIYNDQPACVFIDFSKNADDYLHLVRILSRTKLQHNLVLVGLVDNLSPPEVVKEVIVTGTHLAHVKGPEYYDIVYDVMKLIAPKEIGEHDFAKARVKDHWKAGLPVKIGCVGHEGLHFETDYPLKKGEKIHLKHEWMKKRIVPSSAIEIQKITQANIYYQYQFAVDGDFCFIDQFTPEEGMTEETIKTRTDERNEAILYHKKILSKWIHENSEAQGQKRAKILIIDRDFHFYDNQPRTDKHPYTLRCIPYLEDINYELDRLEPQVIVFNLEKDEAKNPKNTFQKLTELLMAVKNKIQDTSPFVIVFNAKHDSKNLQDSLQYSQLMSSSQDLSVELLEKIADKLEQKISKGDVTSKDDRKVFLKKTNPASVGEIELPIEVTKLSETDLYFQTEASLTDGFNLHLTEPLEMFIHVKRLETQGKIPEYYGLIHGLGEKEKAELRRLVNAIFFRDHDAQILAETEEFKKLNEAKLQEKLEKAKEEVDE